MSEAGCFTLTTPIYYVNARPHIGHAYTTLVADVLARHARLQGKDTFFLTGTDEHGQKIERSAARAGIPPLEFADQVSRQFESLWQRMGLTYNRFIRTTDPDHIRGAQQLFSTLYERGEIYLSSYTGQYCVSEEMFVEGPPGTLGPDGRPTETVTEENFFFRLSEYQVRLIDLIASDALKVTPEARKNEVLSFLRGNPAEFTATTPGGVTHQPGALRDLSVSRSSFTWGIPVPEPAASATTQKHVIYVWLDALANYITACGYGDPSPEAQTRFARLWPADLHLVGKEIIRFHCVYWPAFLLAAGLDLPKAVTAHGWLLFDDAKMSKSRGNVVRTETLLDAFGEEVYAKAFRESTKHDRDLFASDVLRYFLLREIPFGQDGSFSFEAMVTRYDADLTNSYGNLVKRVLTMIESYDSGKVLLEDRSDWTEGQWLSHAHKKAPAFEFEPDADAESAPFAYTMFRVIEHCTQAREVLAKRYGNVGFQAQLAEIMLAIRMTDGFLSAEAPWKLAKRPEMTAWRQEVLYTAAESIRIITALLHHFMPYSTAKVWRQLGLGDIEQAAANGELRTEKLHWGQLKPGTKLGPLAPIFPRADKGLAQIMSDMESANSPAPPQPENTPDPNTPIGDANAAHDAASPDTNDFPEAPIASAADTAPEAKRPLSRLVDETVGSTRPAAAAAFDPAAPPRTSSFADPAPGTTVAGSAAVTTERPGTPPHAEAHPSGIFSGSAAATPTIPSDSSPQIAIDDFAKVELRVAKVLVAERIPKADKLLRLEVDLGYERRQILSGIAQWYTPEDLVDRRIVVITNLAPRKMRGLESHGMLLAASAPDSPDGTAGRPALATFLDSDDLPLGSRLR